MQNRNYRSNESEKTQKKPERVPRVLSPMIRSRILITHQSKFNENTKASSNHNLVVPFAEGYGGRQIKDVLTNDKSQGWQTLLRQTFEKFLLQLDELFMNLRTEERYRTVCKFPVLNSYKDICEKLRLEVLIAIDKLEVINSKRNLKGKDIEFLDRMGTLQSQLTQIRWQYHQAIQELNDSS